MSQAAAAGTLDERETRLVAIAMQCLKSGAPDVDLDKFAAMAGYASAASAGNAWRPLKNKIFNTAADVDGAVPVTPKKKRGPNKAKKAAEDGATEGEDDATPKKTPKRKAAPKDSGEDGASPKKRGRKPTIKSEEKVKEDEEDDGE
ncbi:hypothetical protein H2201_005308 [Coniosporium apollinis]|uniref:Uncharacterized protein n=1 Tax=Coniosporium apollinis TaxID=61459 RepID=A0ABQ9NTE9_9PEZI|nr:hypothetical protein H2201_005308 [Coniosporium apollinis]